MERKTLTLEERQANFDKHSAQICGADSLLVLKEKHGDIYFSIPDVTTLYDVALAVLKTRHSDGWFSEPEAPESYDTTLEEINAIPSEKIKTALLKEYENHQVKLRVYNHEKQEYDAIVDAIKKKDGRCAWRVLRDHKSYEYEDWDVEYLTTVKEYARGGV